MTFYGFNTALLHEAEGCTALQVPACLQQNILYRQHSIHALSYTAKDAISSISGTEGWAVGYRNFPDIRVTSGMHFSVPTSLIAEVNHLTF